MNRAIGIALLCAMSAQAGETPRRMALSVGSWARLDLPAAVGAGVCNDSTIVRTEARHGELGVLGLKVGRTTCGYWTTAASPHWLFDIRVVP